MKKLVSLIIILYAKLVFTLVFFISCIYLLSNDIQDKDYSFYYISAWCLWIIILFFILVINLIKLIRLFNANEIDVIQKYTYTIKYSLIPYWIINFFLSLIFWIIILGASRGLGVFILPLPILFNFCMLCFTSMYSVSYILLLWKNDYIKNSHFLLYTVSQFFFVIDILGLVILKKKLRKADI